MSKKERKNKSEIKVVDELSLNKVKEKIPFKMSVDLTSD